MSRRPISSIAFRATRCPAMLAASVLVACGGGTTARGPTGDASSVEVRLQEQQVDDRPQVASIVRTGDPRPGMALVLGNDSTTGDSILLGAVLANRLERALPDFDVRLGLGVISLVGSVIDPKAVISPLRELDNVLRREISGEELRDPQFLKHWRRLDQLVRAAGGELERRACLGEGEDLPPVGTPEPVVARLESHRRRLFSQANARWGVVGDETTVTAVIEGVQQLPSWPESTPLASRRAKTDSAAWRAGDPGALRLAIRLGQAERVFALKRLLDERPQPAESTRRSARAFALPRGGCLRIDWTSVRRDHADATLELLATARRTIDEARGGESTDQGGRLAQILAAVEETDATRAAQLSALVSLSRDAAKPDDRLAFALEVTAPSTEGPRSESSMLAQVGAPPSAAARLATVSRVEKGQGRIYALLASPCVPQLEPPRFVGSAAVYLEAVVEGHSGADGVTLETWVAPEGAGLVASTGRQTPQESAVAQAERLGRVLGRAVSTIPDNDAFWRARTTLLAQLGPGPRPALWQAVSSLAPGAPGLLAPRGTFASVEALKPLELRERMRLWQAQNLRLAFLSSDHAEDVRIVERAVSRWLGPYRVEAKACPRPSLAAAELQDAESESGKDSGDASATVALPLPSTEPLDGIYADWLVHALAMPGGWLEQLAQQRDPTASYAATLLGGRARRGLVVAVGVASTQPDEAIAALKGLFADLGKSTRQMPLEVAQLVKETRAAELRRLADPRQRLVDLWLDAGGLPEPTDAGFRAYLGRAFASGNVSVVRAPSRPEGSQKTDASQSTVSSPAMNQPAKLSAPQPSPSTKGKPRAAARPGSVSRP